MKNIHKIQDAIHHKTAATYCIRKLPTQTDTNTLKDKRQILNSLNIQRQNRKELAMALDRTEELLALLVVAFGLVIPAAYDVYLFVNNINFIELWNQIVYVIQGLGILSAVGFSVHRFRKKHKNCN